MKNAGYFENCKGIIPIILDCDIGHVPPQMPIVNGAILEVMCEKGEGVIKTFLR